MNFVGTMSIFNLYIINVICWAGGQHRKNRVIRTNLGWQITYLFSAAGLLVSALRQMARKTFPDK